jgi:hypothetical protein
MVEWVEALTLVSEECSNQKGENLPLEQNLIEY